MDSFERNKILGAIVLALLVGTVAGMLGRGLVHPKFLEKNAYPIEGVNLTQTAVPGLEKALEGPESIEPLLAAASVEEGQKIAKKCLQCHSFDKGGANKVGPNLWGVVMASMGRVTEYAYSKGLKDRASQGEAWTTENLNQYLYKPRGFIKGTKMSFAGLKKAKDRAAIVAYLNSKSDAPVTFEAPAPETKKASGEGEKKDLKTEPEENAAVGS